MPLMDRPTLAKRADAGEAFDFVFFWGHTPKDAGVVDASCLSQWYPAPFTVEGVKYATAEHFMMAEKARVFKDPASEQLILAASSPGEVKRLGRATKNFDRPAWEKQRVDVVVRGSVAKFQQNPDLWKYLDSTGECVLVEASPDDAIWGIGYAKDDERAQDPRRWRGENLLGFALMAARARLRAG